MQENGGRDDDGEPERDLVMVTPYILESPSQIRT